VPLLGVLQFAEFVKMYNAVCLAGAGPDAAAAAEAALLASLDDDICAESFATLSGHSGYVTAVAVAPDGKTLYSGSFDSTVRPWALPGGECVTTLSGHSWGVRTLAVSPDGKTLYSGSADNTVRAWALPGGECVATLSGHSVDVNALAVAPDGKTLYSGSDDETVRAWITKRWAKLIQKLTKPLVDAGMTQSEAQDVFLTHNPNMLAIFQASASSRQPLCAPSSRL
jgi:WD40 repeat protein